MAKAPTLKKVNNSSMSLDRLDSQASGFSDSDTERRALMARLATKEKKKK